ncbi:MAG: beta-galactosidase trimerization domain-containing protein, partial [Coriobacteriales bacterium]|nr:beta-galactosidase trimerization domain-containing protein [Coriobacteriales bacterium]
GDAEALDAWASLVSGAIREGDPDRPITLGSDPETLAGTTRIDQRDVSPPFEFGMSHPTGSYLAHVAAGPVFAGPPTRLRGFLLQAARRGLPTVADGLGVLSLDCSPAEEAATLRLDLATSLLHGAAGAMLGRWSDLVTQPREPYRIGPHEVLVGVTDSEGRRKASYEAFSEFARLAAAADLTGVEPLPERVGVLMGAERFAPLPSLGSVVAPRSAFAAWRAAREAQIPTTIVHEDDDPTAYGALVVPSAGALSDETWTRLTSFVADGGTLLYSFGGGDAHPVVREIFGVDFLGDSGPRDSFDVRVAQPGLLGDLTSFDARLRQHAYALLAPGDATVVATDAKGNPLLTVSTYGQGRAVFLASPLERAICAAEVRYLADEVPAFLRTVIGAAARGAGCAAPVEANDPDVELGLLQGAEDDILLAVNHARSARTPEITSARRVAAISDVRGGSPVAIGASTFGVPLGASGVAILRIVYG